MRKIILPSSSKLRFMSGNSHSVKVLPFHSSLQNGRFAGSAISSSGFSITTTPDPTDSARKKTTICDGNSTVAEIGWLYDWPDAARVMDKKLDVVSFTHPDMGFVPLPPMYSSKASRWAWCLPSATGDTEAFWVVQDGIVYYFSDLDRYDVILREVPRPIWRFGASPATLRIDSEVDTEELLQLLVQYIMLDSMRGRLIEAFKEFAHLFERKPKEAKESADGDARSSLRSRFGWSLNKLGRKLRRNTVL